MSDKPVSAPADGGPRVVDPVEDVLGGAGRRGEVAACPTGLADTLPEDEDAPAPENTLGAQELLEARQGQDDEKSP
jgi:hypothetical protein